ncbi:hypothetical protein [Spirosoma endophyticum]|uniref:Uncharacterized protein n=1 Tax=Spirosoma endophyticum TaxID=662367 RepID=A0A1I2B8N6_9BACT|nr:hypothetical protein [Spirosoma endophyticum]SFE52524.1 hypothetical protein SAMN05216167_11525 [Spirosoma endophyticum]
MPNRKLVISLGELQHAFDRLPNSGETPEVILPIELMNSPEIGLRFIWDTVTDKWQLSADNIIITI